MRNLFNLFAEAMISADDAGIPTTPLTSATMNSILNAIFAIAGVVAVLFIILGGIRLSTSQGNSSNTQKGRETIIYAVAGLIVVIAGFTIVNFVVGRL